MNLYVREKNGTLRNINLGSKSPLASGGEGDIYRDPGDPTLVVKIFNRPTPEKEAKLYAMMTNSPDVIQKTQTGGTVVRICWPVGIVYEGSSKFVGYVMPYLDIAQTVTLQEFLNERLREKRNLRGDGSSDYEFRLTTAINLSLVLEYVHKCGHAVVDLKPQNILVNRSTGVVTFIDCDSYRVTSGGNVFPADVGTGEYLAPESFNDIPNAGLATDLFALGVILTQIVNNDLHPSTGQVHQPTNAPDSIIARLRQGIVSVNTSCVFTPHVRSIEAFLPDEIISFFRQALLAKPDQRPRASAWRVKLNDLLDNQLRPCPQGVQAHTAFTKGCPWCAIAGTAAVQRVAPPVSGGGGTSPGTQSNPRQAGPSKIGILSKFFTLVNLAKLRQGRARLLALMLVPLVGILLVLSLAYVGAVMKDHRLEEEYESGVMYEAAQNYAEALNWYRKAAEQGHAGAQKDLGNMYANGRGVVQNDAEAVSWYRKAAEQGFAKALNNLGVAYAYGKGVAQNDVEAVSWYRKAAEQGVAQAQFNLGNMYSNGRGLVQNDAEAVSWYRKAAEQGYANAQFNLGYMYAYGKGIAQNDAEAVNWYLKAAEQGDANAQFNLGYMYAYGKGIAQNDAEAVSWYLKAAEQGDANAQVNLGYMYAYGKGIAQNDAEAVNWYLKAAEQGDANAQYGLGFMYANGKGVAQNDAEAVNWYRKAAEQSVAQAQYYLGLAYANGKGVAQNDAEAVNWYRKAAEQGYSNAQYNLGVAHANGKGVAQNDAEAVSWYRKAAEQGYSNAQSNLGFMYENGKGVAQNNAEAVSWYRRAAEQGYSNAQYNLGVAYANGKGVAQNDAEAVSWYRRAAEQGYANAQYGLGYMYANGKGVAQNDAEAVSWYRKAAEQGNANAQYNLRVMYDNGGVVQN